MKESLKKTKFEITREKGPKFSISDGWLYVDLNTAKRHPLFGTSGWVSFFRLILYVSPVVGILAGIEKLSLLNGQYTDLILFSFFIDFLLLFFSWLLASELANPEPESLNYFFVYLISAIVLLFVTASIVINLAYSSNPQIDILLALHLFRDSITITILAFYFCLSDRVNITYRHRIKSGSEFAKSLELSLFEIPSETLRIENESVIDATTVKKTEDIINTHKKENVELVSIDEIDDSISTQQIDLNSSDNFFSRLFALKKVLDDGLITNIDYEEKKKSILNDL